MASEVVVVATNVGGVSEAVMHGTTGMLVSPDDYGQFLEALRILVSDREMRQRLAKNAHTAIARFTPSVIGNQILNAYDDLLKKTAHIP
jgi:glycosyltransferase involved in cell wall biosynthesis